VGGAETKAFSADIPATDNDGIVADGTSAEASDEVAGEEIGGIPANPEMSDVTLDARRIEALRQRWLKAVRPHSAALREAAQTHYDVIGEMRPRAAAPHRRGRSPSAGDRST
jgi:hypothetical protein